MRIKFLLHVLFLVFVNYLCSQEINNKITNTNSAKVICLVNDSIIASENVIEGYKKEIEELSVLLEKPDKGAPYYSLAHEGLFFVKLKRALKSKSQKELNTFFGLKADNLIYVNGHAVNSTAYYIAIESIDSVIITKRKMKNQFEQKFLNILLASSAMVR